MLRGDLLFLDARTPKPVLGSGRPDWLEPALKEVPLFAALSKRHLKRVLRLVQAREYADGMRVVTRGTRGEGFHIVLDGEARVEFPGGDAETLKPGDGFGELALVDGAPRAATIIAVGRLRTAALSRRDFRQLLRDEPSVAVGLLPGLVRIIRELERDAMASVASARVHEERAGRASASYDLPGGQDLLESKAALGEVPVFAPLTKKHLHRVAKLCAVKRYGNGSVLVREGERGDSFGIVLEGRAQVQTRDGSTFDLLPGSSYGELALIDGAARLATVTADGDVTVAVVTRRDFQAMLRKEPEVAIGLTESLVRLIRLLEA